MFTPDTKQVELQNVMHSVKENLCKTYQVSVLSEHTNSITFKYRFISLSIQKKAHVILSLRASCLYNTLNKAVLGLTTYDVRKGVKDLDDDASLNYINKNVIPKAKQYFGDNPLINVKWIFDEDILYTFDVTDLDPVVLGYISKLLTLGNVEPRPTAKYQVTV